MTSIYLGNSITDIWGQAFDYTNIKEVNYNTNQPIRANKSIFPNNTYNNAILNVAQGGLEKAMSTEPWMFFKNIQEVVPPVVDAESVAIHAPMSEINAGKVMALSAVVFPENATCKEVNWTSSDPEIASVDETGMLTALSVGKTQIKAVVVDTDIFDVVEITVIPKESLSLEPSEISAHVGEIVQITVEVFPESVLEWDSNDKSVALVDQNGLVTAVGVGDCIISAATTDGTNLTATCHVIILPVLVESMAIDPNEWSGVEGESFQIIATLVPENATEKTLRWSSSNEAVAIVDDNGLVSVLKEGTCIITAKTTDGSRLYDECIVTSVSGIDELFADADAQFDVYVLDGALIRKDADHEYLKNLRSGAYIIVQGSEARKVIIR